MSAESRDGTSLVEKYRPLFREMFEKVEMRGVVDPFFNRDPRRLGRYGG